MMYLAQMNLRLATQCSETHHAEAAKSMRVEGGGEVHPVEGGGEGHPVEGGAAAASMDAAQPHFIYDLLVSQTLMLKHWSH